MRRRIDRHPLRPARSRVTAAGGALLLLAIFEVATAGCSSDSVVSKTPSVSVQSSVAPLAAKALTLARSIPIRVQIPAIHVDSKLMGLGLRKDGSMQVPPVGFPAGWYTGAPTPGELGPAIIAGHVDWGGRAGVFYHLRDLKPGAEVRVARQDGSTAVFRVTRVGRFPKTAFPTRVVFGNIDHAGLRLITCGGSFNRRARSYVDDIVVFADLVGHTERRVEGADRGLQLVPRDGLTVMS